MTTISVEAAQAQLNELINQLAPGQELVLTRDSQPIARLIAGTKPVETQDSERRPIFGRGRGDLIILSEDNDHLEDFVEYME